MILHCIELRCVGPFHDAARLGPFNSGLNIIAAPNEAGKTTALRAAARALFDRHTTKSEELKCLQPVGTELCPQIAVDFSAGQQRYRIEKCFLQSPTSVLKVHRSGVWENHAEGDAADRKVQEILHASLPGRGVTKPEHWGYLGYLWARQGEVAAWPTLDDEGVGQKIRARLAQIELDPVIEKVRARLSSMSEEVMTSRGKPKIGGIWDSAEKELENVESALSAIRQTRDELETTRHRHEQALATVARLEAEQSLRAQSAKHLTQLATTAERLKGELDARRKELDAAREKLHIASRDAETTKSREAERIKERAALDLAEKTVTEEQTKLSDLRQNSDLEKTQRTSQEQTIARLRAQHEQVQSLLKLRQVERESVALHERQTQATTSASAIASLQEQLASLPALTQKKLTSLNELSHSVVVLRARLEALGLTADVQVERDVCIRIEGDTHAREEKLAQGSSTSFHSPQNLVFTLEGWGRIAIRSGSDAGRDAARELAQAETEFRTALEKAEVPSLDAAREILFARQTLEVELKAARAAHAERLGAYASLDDLKEAAAALQRRCDSLTATISTSPSELTLVELESEEARLAAQISSEEKQLTQISSKLTALETAQQTAREKVQISSETSNELRTRVRLLDTQISELAGRYPEGLEVARTAAQNAFVQAEARFHVTKEQLPPDYEQLPERTRRAIAAAQQVADSLQSARRDRDGAHAVLQSLGSQGLYSRENALEEKHEEILLRREAARTQGWATRILSDLIEHRKHAATRAVLSPLEDRLTTAFAQLTGNRDRRVFLNDTLQIAGLGRTRDAVYPFDNLSQGAREQLLLCLRIAVAQELSVEEPQVLILDDVLVNTDSSRQERVLDLLSELESTLQILVLTCHPDRYRGVGQAVDFA